MKRTHRLAAVALALMLPLAALAAPINAVLYKTPQCGCCDEYANYLRDNGFDVTVEPTNELAQISQQAGVPEELEGCHTMLLQDYVVSGHVPVDIVHKLLAERPPIAGITLPGMPSGSPGMSGPKTESFKIYAIPQGGAPTIYAIR
ncbi:MAG TPA: DUF411 domain-containing protein [Burkholderiaceae bacterium]|jgi:hypothetical protein|nr:DUF411 domain-containing protein [Burkholderiaceae bacterium]